MGGDLRVTPGADCRPVGPLQVLALCHIAVGQQMNLHWLHKVRAPPRGQTGRGWRPGTPSGLELLQWPTPVLAFARSGLTAGLGSLPQPSQGPCDVGTTILFRS